MKETAEARKRRERVVKTCESLPEVTTRGGEHYKFTVRDKTFAYHLFDHHGDGVISVCCKAAAGAQDVLLRMDPARYFVPSYLGGKGWVGQRIDLNDIDWDETRQLIVDSYRLVAPKKLAASVAGA